MKGKIIFEDIINDFQETHYNSLLSRTILNIATIKTQLYIHRQKDCMDLFLTMDKSIVFHNRFSVLSEDEFLYYTFFVVEQFKLESNAFDREIVNISSGKSLTLHELAKLIAYRSSLVLGIKPPINLSLTKEVINPLIISNNKLSCIFPHKIDTNLSDEIDRLLLNCRQWFQ